VFHPQLEQVRARLADQRARPDAQYLHDLVAVQVRPDAGEPFALGQLGDALLQVVVRPRQPPCLRLIPGRAIGSGEGVQAGEQRAGIGDVPADCRVGPLTRPVAVKPQVQPDQPGHVGHHVLREPQRGQPGPGQLGADHLVVMEGNAAVRQQRPRFRLADVVQQRGQPQHQIGLQAVPVLQPDGLAEHGQRMLVDVLVPVVLVRLQPEPRHLGEDLLGHAGIDEHRDAVRRAAGPLRQQQLGQLSGDPLRGHDREPGRQLGHGSGQFRRRGEAQLGSEPCRAQRSQRVIGQRVLRPARRPEHAVLQVTQPAEEVHQLIGRQPRGHRIDGEVAAGQVPLQ